MADEMDLEKFLELSERIGALTATLRTVRGILMSPGEAYFNIAKACNLIGDELKRDRGFYAVEPPPVLSVVQVDADGHQLPTPGVDHD